MDIGVAALITFIVFVILKLTHTVPWSWWIVCIPAIVFGLLLILHTDNRH